jgi:alpha-mannosidase
MQHFTVEKITKQLVEIRQAIYRETLEIPGFKYIERNPPGAHRPELDDADWWELKVGDRWGGYDVTAWFRAAVELPQHWRGGRVYARFLAGPRDGGDSTAETLLYVNGELLQGIDIWHEDAWLPPEITERGRVQFALKVWSGVLGVPDQRRFRVAQVGLVDPAVEQLAHRTEALLGALKELDQNDLRRVRLLALLDGAYRKLDFTSPRSDAFYASAHAAAAHLSDGLAAFAELEELKPKVSAVGHAHIDMAWLWRLEHSREKAAHTFSTALHFMRQYPEYRFTHSSPQLYEYVRRDYPELFARVKERIAAGQWEITGGMWVESDTNLVSGEALIRQFLHGTRYMREEFGVESKLLWLPDVFGYSYALPQIARGCGMEYFLTSKLSWSQFNRFPHDTFRWRGLDGTELLTHFVTTPERGSRIYTYNGELRPWDVKGAWDNYRQKDVNDELLVLYGWGDGGGGPTREMLESGRALANLPGLPSVRQELGEPFFARLAERLEGKELPVWDGELYLEYHRGTYTSQAATKRANRKSELLYHDAELLAALADTLTGEARYPHAELDEGWKLILLNQFHDILPGSSIRQVYEDAAADYARVEAIGRQALAEASERIARRVHAPRGGLLVLNSLAWQRDGLVSLPWSPELAGRTLLLDEGRPARTQAVEEEGERRVLVEVGGVPPLGYRVFPWGDAGDARQEPGEREGALSVTPRRLESRFYQIELNERGQIARLYDKRAGREVLPSGARANVLQAFTDKPLAFDAWDIDIYYQETLREVGDLAEAVVEEAGPLRGTLRLSWRFNRSTITQRLTIYRDDPRIDFRSEVDWHEQQILLKAAFPVEVRATRATYDIQFGQVERPTHWNTSWDWARFEVCAHKWADLSEGNYGVALLNDCKYGHDVRDNVLRLTLIKSAVRPDAEADKGRHIFTYSLLPHQGDWRQGEVDRAGYDLNLPLHAAVVPAQPDGALPAAFAFAEVDAEHVVVETVKRAEDDPDAWVVRVYEGRQFRAPGVRLRFGRPLRRAQRCNLVEREAADIPFEGDSLRFGLAPYEIATFKVWFSER